jgi:hypothetical protein
LHIDGSLVVVGARLAFQDLRLEGAMPDVEAAPDDDHIALAFGRGSRSVAPKAIRSLDCATIVIESKAGVLNRPSTEQLHLRLVSAARWQISLWLSISKRTTGVANSHSLAAAKSTDLLPIPKQSGMIRIAFIETA